MYLFYERVSLEEQPEAWLVKHFLQSCQRISFYTCPKAERNLAMKRYEVKRAAYCITEKAQQNFFLANSAAVSKVTTLFGIHFKFQ
jgi:hypothetical protein